MLKQVPPFLHIPGNCRHSLVSIKKNNLSLWQLYSNNSQCQARKTLSFIKLKQLLTLQLSSIINLIKNWVNFTIITQMAQESLRADTREWPNSIVTSGSIQARVPLTFIFICRYQILIYRSIYVNTQGHALVSLTRNWSIKDLLIFLLNSAYYCSCITHSAVLNLHLSNQTICYGHIPGECSFESNYYWQ